MAHNHIGDVSTLPNVTPLPEVWMLPFQTHQDAFKTYDIVMKQESKIFNVINPNENLRRDNNGLIILSSTHIHLDSQKSGGVNNILVLVKYANATRVQCDLWLQKCKLPSSRETSTLSLLKQSMVWSAQSLSHTSQPTRCGEERLRSGRISQTRCRHS